MDFSQNIITFHNLSIYESKGHLVGYAYLIKKYKLNTPFPDIISIIGKKHKKYSEVNYNIFTPRHMPNDSISGHLTFSLKYEGINLAILNSLFNKINISEIEDWILSEPNGQYSRKIWFLYEWLTDKKLNVENLTQANYINLVDSKLQYTGSKVASKRHRINNNLLGNKYFCPYVRKTDYIENYISQNLNIKAQNITQELNPELLHRAAAFLLLEDSKASFFIEGETPSNKRAENWSKTIAAAGIAPLSTEEICKLQKIIIEDDRFIKLGIRKDEGFIGIHNRKTMEPIPSHISAKYEDLPKLMDGLINTYNSLKKSELNPVIQAAIIAFGFVFIHPLIDGNGRIHRYIFHHILSETNFTPQNVIFPISSSILENIAYYQQVLEYYSKPRLEFIEWESRLDGNVNIINDTIDLYRFFDATKQVEFLFYCIDKTLESHLLNEITYLQMYDSFVKEINNKFNMPNNLTDLLINFLIQNKGSLSKRAREKEFKLLTNEEIIFIEKLFKNIFNQFK